MEYWSKKNETNYETNVAKNIEINILSAKKGEKKVKMVYMYPHCQYVVRNEEKENTKKMYTLYIYNTK